MTKRCNKDVSPECTSPIPVSTSDSNMSKLCASRNSQLGTRAWTNPESAGSNFTDGRIDFSTLTTVFFTLGFPPRLIMI